MDISTIDLSALLTAVIGIVIIAVPAAWYFGKKASKEFAAEISGAMADFAEVSNDSAAVVDLLAKALDDDKITAEEVQGIKTKALEAKTHMTDVLNHIQAIASKLGK